MSQIKDQSVVSTIEPPTIAYSVEYFHIYTDETINGWHEQGLEIMRGLVSEWTFPYESIVLIDDYNPTETVTTPGQILEYLDSKQMSPTFWALEGDMVPNAQQLLASIPDSKLKRSYIKYIDNHGKYPCSLLTASWYLTRLGQLDMSPIRTQDGSDYQAAHYLFNLLPESYKPVEARAMKLIAKSPYAHSMKHIQDFFYPAEAQRALDLF